MMALFLLVWSIGLLFYLGAHPDKAREYRVAIRNLPKSIIALLALIIVFFAIPSLKKTLRDPRP